MSSIPFTKAQGAGNDFLIVEATALPVVPSAALVQQICDRHRGIGADGLLWLKVPGSEGAHADLRIFNADGREAEISGNGTRCAAAHLLHTAQTPGGPMLIRTAAGLKQLRLIHQHGNEIQFEMAVGQPILEAAPIPFHPPQPVRPPIVHFELPLSSGARRVTITSMGNPHCSLAVEDFHWDWQALGAEIERHPFFPNRTNVEFYRVRSNHELEVRYWERGVGVTLSSGTGSCAAAVAAILNRQAESPVTVVTLAGELRVRWDDAGVFLTGPAEIICRGEYYPGDEIPSVPDRIPTDQ